MLEGRRSTQDLKTELAFWAAALKIRTAKRASRGERDKRKALKDAAAQEMRQVSAELETRDE